MKRINRILTAALCALLLAALCALPGSAAGGFRVTEMSTDCTLSGDSSCSTVIRARVEFDAVSNGFSVPVPPDAYDISVAGYNFSASRSGSCLLLQLKGSFSGTRDIVISYRQLSQAEKSDSGQRLKLHLLYSAWNCEIESYRLTVNLPADSEGLPDFIGTYYGEQADNYLEILPEGPVLNVTALQPMHAQESLIMTWDLPDGFFDLRFLQGKTVKLDLIVFFLLVALCAVYWLVRLGGRPKLPKPQPQPPLGCNAGLVPYLLRGAAPSTGLLAAYWATLGYLTISREKKQHASRLNFRMEMGNERKPYEEELFRDLFSQKDSCGADAPAMQTLRNRCAELVDRFWRKKLYAKHSGKPWVLRATGALAGFFCCLYLFDSLIAPQSFRWFLIIPMTLAGTAACFALQFAVTVPLERRKLRRGSAALFALTYLITSAALSGTLLLTFFCIAVQLLIGAGLLKNGRRTAVGRAQFLLLLGLRKYLRRMDAAKARAHAEQDPLYFYRMLPFAEALGVGARFAKKFRFADLEPCPWFDWKGKYIRDSVTFRELFASVLDEFDEKPGRFRF